LLFPDFLRDNILIKTVSTGKLQFEIHQLTQKKTLMKLDAFR